MKWRTNELLNCSKSSMDDKAKLLNQTDVASLKVVKKDRHTISLEVWCKLKVVLKVVMWSNKSFKSSYESSYVRQNFDGKGHSKILVVKGEFVIFTIPSRFLVVFSFVALFSLCISFLTLLRRSSLILSSYSVLPEPSLLWLVSRLWTSSSFLLWSTSLVRGDFLLVVIAASFFNSA